MQGQQPSHTLILLLHERPAALGSALALMQRMAPWVALPAPLRRANSTECSAGCARAGVLASGSAFA